MKDISLAVETLLRDGEIKSVVVFVGNLSDVKFRVKATRKVYKSGGTDKNTFILTLGKLNYGEREFIKLCKKANTKPRRVWIKHMKNCKKGGKKK